MKRRYNTEPIVTTFGVIERLAESHIISWIKPEESWQSSRNRFEGDRWNGIKPRPWLAPELSTSYGDWRELGQSDPIDDSTFVMIDYCGGSDYSGDLVNVSNHKALVEALEAAELIEGEDYIQYHGGHGTFDLAIRVHSLILTRDCDSIIETIEGLEDYPLIDESLHSEMEIESQNEAWGDWARRDFQRELGKYFAGEIDNEEFAEFAEDGDWVTDELADRWFYDLAEYANECWVNEQGSDSYIDVERVVKNGISRELNHWPEGELKRRALVAEIRTTLDSAYAAVRK